MAALAVELGGVDLMPEASSGFTQQDRETLVTVKVQLGFLQDTVGSLASRIAKVEETRLTSRDLQELMADTDTLRAEKKVLEDRLEKQKVVLEDQIAKQRDQFEARITVLEAWRWKMLGAASAASALVGLLFKLIVK